MPESPYPLFSIEEAHALVLANVPRLQPTRVSLPHLFGKILAEDVEASEPQPPFLAAAKDGYAVVASDATKRRRVLGEQVAGTVSTLQVQPGSAIKITTGAPLPSGADAVVMIENTVEEAGFVEIQTEVAVMQDVRPIGVDVAKGQRVLAKGAKLGPAEIGLLASVGHMDALVYPAPKIGVLSTGDELREPNEALAPGQIRDSNRFSLMAAIAMAGGIPLDLGIVRDRPGELETKVMDGIQTADALVTSGGVSMGQLDLLKPLLAARGKIHFGRVNMKPGKPLTFATLAGKPVFALPGFPVSSLVSFEIFVRPALLFMQGMSATHRPEMQVQLTHDVARDPHRWEFARAILQRNGNDIVATTTGSQSSGRLLSLAGANALLVLPPGEGIFNAGSFVKALVLEAI